MKAIVYTDTGDANVLSVVERDIPAPGPGEVRVRVAVSGVNPTDWKSRAGSSTRRRVSVESVPNQDGSGTVDAVGPGVSSVSVGDRVWIYLAAPDNGLTGTAQEYTVQPEHRVVKLPAEASLDVGASLGVPAMTAHRALTVIEGGPTRLSPGALTGRTVLVAGGAGAVGHAAIQLGVWAGATVITTVSGPEKAALAGAAGADHVINYRTDDVVARVREIAPEGVDVVVEVSPSKNWDIDLAVIKPRGTVAVYANDGGNHLDLNIGAGMGPNVRLQFMLLYTVGDEVMTAAAQDIGAALADGALPVGEEHGLPLLRFGLEDMAAAHDAVQAGTVGKVLVDVPTG
ncbi:NADPH:quinone reductase [Kineosporia sp. NBRC 101731]|uniref:NADPH:quinone reductase n=1 Tax=Kineosporia sp. NBRC 101731 TaxID=3032199 RepID=UPI0024A5FC84|nr:NADPH:quinone reductase [Kineosporia sp. NBRC 101731]GLY29314.1 NADPH:quinone reductase [Kineosporia sp. NBRC 101731]